MVLEQRHQRNGLNVEIFEGVVDMGIVDASRAIAFKCDNTYYTYVIIVVPLTPKCSKYAFRIRVATARRCALNILLGRDVLVTSWYLP